MLSSRLRICDILQIYQVSLIKVTNLMKPITVTSFWVSELNKYGYLYLLLLYFFLHLFDFKMNFKKIEKILNIKSTIFKLWTIYIRHCMLDLKHIYFQHTITHIIFCIFFFGVCLRTFFCVRLRTFFLVWNITLFPWFCKHWRY